MLSKSERRVFWVFFTALAINCIVSWTEFGVPARQVNWSASIGPGPTVFVINYWGTAHTIISTLALTITGLAYFRSEWVFRILGSLLSIPFLPTLFMAYKHWVGSDECLTPFALFCTGLLSPTAPLLLLFTAIGRRKCA